MGGRPPAAIGSELAILPDVIRALTTSLAYVRLWAPDMLKVSRTGARKGRIAKMRAIHDNFPRADGAEAPLAEANAVAKARKPALLW